MTSSRDLEMIRKITNTFLASVKILGQLHGCIIPLLKALFCLATTHDYGQRIVRYHELVRVSIAYFYVGGVGWGV